MIVLKIIHFFRENDTVIALAQADMYRGYIIVGAMCDGQFDRAIEKWSYKEWVERDRIMVGIETFLDVYNTIYRTRGHMYYQRVVYYE